MFKCYCCSDSNFKTAFEYKNYKILECKNCSTAYTFPRVESSAIKEYYDKKYYQPSSLSFISQLLRYYLIAKGRIKQLEKYVIKGNVLDYGCGDGMFISSFSKNRWQIYGSDTSKDSLELARSNGVKTINENELFNRKLNNFFDLITCIHVIEHISDLQTYVERFHNLLKPGGYIQIEVPNYKSPLSRFFNKDWPSNADIPRHMNHFSENGLKTLMQANHFQLVKKNGSLFRSLLYTTYLIMLFIKMKTKSTYLAYIGSVLLLPFTVFYIIFIGSETLEFLFKKV